MTPEYEKLIVRCAMSCTYPGLFRFPLREKYDYPVVIEKSEGIGEFTANIISPTYQEIMGYPTPSETWKAIVRTSTFWETLWS